MQSNSEQNTVQRLALRDDGTPYYRQLESVIRRQISDHTLNIGDRLPTLKQLVSIYGVSTMTVRNALARLEKEGLIRAERGRGTFVTGSLTQASQVPYLLTRSPEHRGPELSFRVLASRAAQNELIIRPDDGGKTAGYQYMKRIFSRNSAPFAVGEYLIDSAVHARIPKEQWSSELISTILFDKKEAGLAHVRQTFRVMTTGLSEAKELGIGGQDPVVIVRRIFQNREKQVICLAQLAYRTDGVVFDINIETGNRDRLLELGGFPEA